MLPSHHDTESMDLVLARFEEKDEFFAGLFDRKIVNANVKALAKLQLAVALV
jgi:hypothetical protein